MDVKILFETNVIIYLFIQSIVLLATLFAMWGSWKIYRLWNFESSSAYQYTLEHKSYLVMIVIIFLSILKIALLPFFAFTIDNLSHIIPGAMCAAGVVEDFEWSNFLLSLKLAVIFVAGAWLLINGYDLKAKNYPYMKFKSVLFLLLGVLVVAEFGLELYYFSSLSTKEPVLCCTDIFGVAGSDGTIPFGLDIQWLLILFYSCFLLTILSALNKSALLSFIVNIFFLFIAYYAVVHFFGTYIYQQPTHKCPYCMLQKEYYYVGYFVWGTLFIGVFSGISALFIRSATKINPNRSYLFAMIFNSAFTLLCSSFVVLYYIINGVFL